MVLDPGNKCHQYCICIQPAVVSFCFWCNYTTEIIKTAHCWYHDLKIKDTRHQCWFSSKTHKMADEVRCDGLGHYSISCSFRRCIVREESCRNSREKCKRRVHVMLLYFPWKETILWHYYDNMYYIHYLKMFFSCCHINKKCLLTIPNVFLTC